jgi:hypothetical protein
MSASNSSSFVSVEYSFGDLQTLLLIEQRYQFSVQQCQSFRSALDLASGVTKLRQENQHIDQNLDWRYRIARWLLKASDDLNLARETAAIALTYLDRFMMRRGSIVKREYQLASVTSLFMASKLYEKKPLKMARLVKYTQGVFPPNEIIVKEVELTKVNMTFMFPPTPGAFALMLLNGLSGKAESVKDLIENIRFLTQLTACDFFFLSKRPSTIAVAAMVVSLEQTDFIESSRACLDKIKASGLKLDDEDTASCVKRLKSIFEGNQKQINAAGNREGSQGRSASFSTPPRGRITPSPTVEITAKYSGSKRSRHEM